ncbi:FAD-binding oxidoreductase [Lactiplantibacillus garii]|uniref:FAD-binding oxidoreductase n=1 Tax=Lactiplantibacillus garii TaxID=2306423 RepID=A0A3R8J8B2_9LACO|nr:FAD-binding oxidoreductase [Lactiplantibacillus garii]RRK10917.1 FAD-binding oxidoreductase [Lactiplantibacillus garii]
MITTDQTTALYHQLTANFDASAIQFGDQITADWGHDELGTVAHLPDIVVTPKTTAEVATLAKLASAAKVPMTTRGSGTGLVGGCVPTEGGLLIDMSAMDQIIALDENNLSLTVQTGAQLKSVADYAAEKGFLYAPDPGEKTATIGGNIATNAGGMRAVKYGVTRESVRALTVVTVDGQVLHLGGQIVKNSSGFDLKDLYIGSEGTLGIVTEAVLKISPLPKYSTGLLIPFDDFDSALTTVPKILQSGITPTAVEFFEADTVKYWEAFKKQDFPQAGAAAYLLMTLDGQHEEVVEQDYETLAELCLDNGATDAYVLDTPELKETVWKARDAFLEAIQASTTTMDEADAVVPRDQTAEFVAFTHHLAEQQNVRIPGFGHVGDGNLHLYVCQDDYSDTEWPAKLKTVFEALYAKASELGGKVSGEHGIGYVKRPYLQSTSDSAEMATMRRVKAALDPDNLLNPDKIV